MTHGKTEPEFQATRNGNRPGSYAGSGASSCVSVASGRVTQCASWFVMLLVGLKSLAEPLQPIPWQDPLCGPRALAVYLRMHDIDASISELASLAGTTPSGASLGGLQEACHAKGVDAVASALNRLRR
ncbi:MAG: cysteine peptidase family C39 domain-containing protein [Candidatus Hydrogenedentales bacterium]|jgi:hypothetical protein